MIFDLSREILNARLGRAPTRVLHMPSVSPPPSLIVPFQDRDEKTKYSQDIFSAIEVENVRGISRTLPQGSFSLVVCRASR